MPPGARTFTADTGTSLVNTTTNTPRTVLTVIAGSGQSVRAFRVGIGFDGVTSSDGPAKVELCSSTQATAGSSTSVTPVLTSGLGTVQATAAKAYTAEPTVLTLLEMWMVDPNKGSLILPLEEYPQTPVAGGLCLRVTSAANVNCHASIACGE